MERDHILAVLARNGGNQAQTAQQLDIGTATLYRKLKKHRGALNPRQRSDGYGRGAAARAHHCGM